MAQAVPVKRLKDGVICVKINWKATFVALVATFVGVTLMIGVSSLAPNWDTWRQATSMPNNAFNEAIREGYLRQPWNTFSSFAYLFVGVYIVCLPIFPAKEKSLAIYRNKWIRLIFSLALAITGVGSAFLHLSLTFIGQTADVVGMYLLSVFIILYAVLRRKNVSTLKFVVLFILSNLLLFIPLVLSPHLRRNLFAVLIIVGLILEYFFNRKTEGNTPDLLLASASVMLFGFIFWMIDNTKLFFDPYSWFQGHVVWHLCGAAAAAILYRYYTKENCETIKS